MLPWVGKESIYSYIKRNLNSEGKLPIEYEELPDSTEFYEDKPFRWVSGAMDGIMSHHAGSSEEKENILASQNYYVNKLLNHRMQHEGKHI